MVKKVVARVTNKVIDTSAIGGVAILGLDPAKQTGVADTLGLRAIWDLDVLSRGSHPGKYVLKIGEMLNSRLSKQKYEYVAYEKAAFGSSPAHRFTVAFHSNLEGVILSVCAAKNVDVIQLTPTEIKAASGYGASTKKDLMNAARIQCGEVIENDNIADAFWAVQAAIQKLRIEQE